MITPTRDNKILKKWLGKQEVVTDVITTKPAELMQAVVNRTTDISTGSELPPLWHWLYFLSAQPQDKLGRDGHPKLGGFLPPVDLPRRMWAGGRFEFKRPLRFGETVTKQSTITSIELKEGRSGPLCFVTVRHNFYVDKTLCFSEEHDIVYREDLSENVPPTTSVLPPTGATWETTVLPDPVMLFRYSALTFNGHRIHYDRQYCREVEKYPDLVFHGPLTATLLIGSVLENNLDQTVQSYKFRAVAPLFDAQPFKIKSKKVDGEVTVWAETPDGGLAMQATVKFY